MAYAPELQSPSEPDRNTFMQHSTTPISVHAANVRSIINLCERATFCLATATAEGTARAARYLGIADAAACTLPPVLEDAMRDGFIAPAYRRA